MIIKHAAMAVDEEEIVVKDEAIIKGFQANGGRRSTTFLNIITKSLL